MGPKENNVKIIIEASDENLDFADLMEMVLAWEENDHLQGK